MKHRLWKTKVRIAGCIQRQRELRWKRNTSLLVIQPMKIAMESIWSQFSTVWWMQEVLTVLHVSTATLITRSRAIEKVMLVATTTATTTEVNKLWDEKSSRNWWSVHTNLVTSSTKSVYNWKWSWNWRRSVPEQGRCAFPARSTPDHKSYRFINVRKMINNLITRLRRHSPRTNTRFVWYWTDNERSSTAQDFDGKFGNGIGETLRPSVSSSRQRSFRESEEIDPRPDLEASSGDFSERLVWYRVVHQQIAQMSQLNKLLRDKFTRRSIKSELHPQSGDDDKRRVCQGCSGRSIKPDEGNSYSDRFLREGW